VYPLRCTTAQLLSTTRKFVQCFLILAHSTFNTVCVYRIALLTLGTLRCLYVCMIGQLHALRAQQNKHLLSVEFSWWEHWLHGSQLHKSINMQAKSTRSMFPPRCADAQCHRIICAVKSHSQALATFQI